jgi:uncharacterized protein YuzE
MEKAISFHPHARGRMSERGTEESEKERIMKLTYDPQHNIAYIRLHEKKEAVDTIRLSDEMNVDIAPDGTVYGIELLNANEQMHAEDGPKLIIENEEAGSRREVMLM